MNLSVMNFSDAKAIGEQPEEFCIEDVREALRIMRLRPPSAASLRSTYERHLRKLEAEIATGRTE